MIERIIAFALHQRFITVALAVILTIGGIAAYSRLPIEAYPDVGDVKVEVITLWPGFLPQYSPSFLPVRSLILNMILPI